MAQKNPKGGGTATAGQMDNNHMFLKRALETLLNDKDIKKTQFQPLKRACEAALASINKDSSVSSLPSTHETCFLPFQLACTSNHSRIVDIALDCLQKLLLNGHLFGHIPDPADPTKCLIDRIVSIICNCFHGVQTEERVELQVIKMSLTIMTSPTIEIDQRSVLHIVRTCFNIYLTTRSRINEATAQACLAQILQSIFAKMEQKMSVINERKRVEQISAPANENEEEQSLIREILDELVEKICYDEATQELTDSTRSTNEIIEDIQSTSEEIQYSRTRTTTDTQSIDEPSLVKASLSTSQSMEEQSADNHYRNAYHVFRALCKLSDRDIKNKSNTDSKTNLDLKSRLFSLRLIMQILQTSGPVFRSSDDFLQLIKTHLCVSLSRNGVSSILELFEMALFNFLELIDKFKAHLKIQIEVLFREIFLTILETPTSSFRHKWLVIQTLAKISADAQILVDLFINYDCSMRSANIFERLVIVLSRVAQGRQAVELGCTATEEHNLRIKGLECIVSILRCMVDWSKDLFINPHLQSNLGADSKPVHENGYDRDSNQSSSGYVGSGIRRTDSSSSVVSSQLSENINDFEVVRQRKELFEKGVDLFNQHARKGLEYLFEKNFVINEPEEVAQFFHTNQDLLDQTMIGDCLGEEDTYHKQIMYAYIDQLDFVQMNFLAALRKFLSGFRLPGEAQKIDRLMEKFAARFCECNPTMGVFASADAAYVLAYSVIMLTTDLHSKNVKKKMTKEQYIKMNRGINESGDLPVDFLSKIYDEVKNEEIKLKVGTAKRAITSTATRDTITSDKQRELLFNVQMKDVESIARDLMSNAGSISEEFTIAKHLEHVRPMFQKAWSPCLAAFSVNLQDNDHLDLANSCLTGVTYAIRIACIFHMEMEQNAFIQALSRFTLLMVTSQVMDIKAKNVACLKTLLAIAQTDGNYLGDAWYEILKCISQLELAQLFSVHTTKGKLSLANLPHQSPTTSLNSPIFGSEKGSLNKRLQSIQDQLHETSSQSMIVSVDRVFSGSARLDGDAIVAFVDSLCHVSMDELHSNPPRMFSLLKVVEISYYNMGRIRLQWSRIWAIIGEYFNRVGSHPSQDVSFFAVDSLRQLSMKFLEKGEFANFRFQKEFLKPFEVIMKNNSSLTIRDMVVRCIAHFVHSQAKNIRSGWKNIFSVFQTAASDTDVQIVELAFQTCTHIIATVFDRYFPSILDSFQDAIKCLSEFACNVQFPDTSMEAIRLIRQCAGYVGDKSQIFHDHAGEDLVNVSEQDRIWMKGWFPILCELSYIISRCRLDVRTRALTVMFEIVKNYGETFTQAWWTELFKVIFRIFDTMKLADGQIEKIEWMTTTCNHALYAIIDVFIQFYRNVPEALVNELYGHITWCVHQDSEQLAKSAINCLENFVISCGEQFSLNTWEQTCACLLKIFRSTLPEQLLTWQSDNEPSGMVTINETSILDRTDSSFDHTAVESASSQHHRMQRTGSTASDHRDSHRHASISSNDRTNFLLFQTLTLQSIVQMELIQTIDNLLFYPSNSKKDELKNISLAQKLAGAPIGQDNSVYFSSSDETETEQGIMMYMSFDQIILLVDCLIESHLFARKFNSNNEQRNLLWKAGYRGKSKPNLFVQETHSMTCVLRILFRLFHDRKHTNAHELLQRRLLKLMRDSVEYYLSLQSESQRDAWTSLLMLLLTKLLRLTDERFRYFAIELYLLLSQVVIFDTKSELRYLLREYFLRIGHIFHIKQD